MSPAKSLLLLPLTDPFGARIRFRALLHEGNTRSSAVFWLHASISLSYSLTGVFSLDVPCQITTFVLPGLLPLEPEFASDHSPLEEARGPGRFFGLMLGYRPRIPWKGCFCNTSLVKSLLLLTLDRSCWSQNSLSSASP